MTMILENPPDSIVNTQIEQLNTLEEKVNSLIQIAQQVALGLTQAVDGGFNMDLSKIFSVEE